MVMVIAWEVTTEVVAFKFNKMFRTEKGFIIQFKLDYYFVVVTIKVILLIEDLLIYHLKIHYFE
jgi:hypothetical protein